MIENDSKCIPFNLYKYIPIGSIDTIKNIFKNDSGKYVSNSEFGLVNLLNHSSWLASPRIQNDPFDSYIKLHDPTPREMYDRLSTFGTESSIMIRDNCIENSIKFKQGGWDYITDLRNTINHMINSTPLYCLSSTNDNILMWSHYAKNHCGLCIEYKPFTIEAFKVKYIDEFTNGNILDWINDGSNKEYNSITTNNLINAYSSKLKCWEYENEYRYIHTENNSVKFITNGIGYEFEYNPIQVESIIFGFSMSKHMRYYIMNNLGYTPKFKHVIKSNSGIKIVDY